MDGLTLLEFFDTTYTKKPTMAGGSDATEVVYRSQVHNLQEFFRVKHGRDVALADLTGELISECMAWQKREKGRAPSTCNNLRRSLLAIWRYAHDLRKAEPPAKVAKMKEPKQLPLAWSEEEFLAIIQAAGKMQGRVGPVSEAEFFTAFLWVLFNGGGRVSATRQILWEWVDLRHEQLRIDASVQKDKETILVMLSPQTVEAMLPLAHTATTPYVFGAWPYDGNLKVHPRAMALRLRRLIVAAGLRPCVAAVGRKDLFHRVRKTFATAVYEREGIDVAKQFLGHASRDTTNRYIDPSKVSKKSQAAILADFIKAPQPPFRVVG